MDNFVHHLCSCLIYRAILKHFLFYLKVFMDKLVELVYAMYSQELNVENNRNKSQCEFAKSKTLYLCIQYLCWYFWVPIFLLYFPAQNWTKSKSLGKPPWKACSELPFSVNFVLIQNATDSTFYNKLHRKYNILHSTISWK